MTSKPASLPLYTVTSKGYLEKGPLRNIRIDFILPFIA